MTKPKITCNNCGADFHGLTACQPDAPKFVEEQRRAEEWNDRVWTSRHMADAIKLATDGLAELNRGKGWGLQALSMARMKFRAAAEMVEQIEAWK